MIFFFYGPNTYTARQQIAKLRTQYVTKTGSDLGIERVDGAKVGAGELTAVLQAMPFLSTSRLVIVEGLGVNKAVAPKIESIIADVPTSTVVVIYDPAVDQRTNYFKTLNASAKVVKFELLGVRQLQAWVQAEAKELGAEIEGPVVLGLIEAAGEDQWRLSGELSKLASYNPTITMEAAKTLVVPGGQQSIFDLTDDMTAGKASSALERYHGLLAERVSEMYILSMVLWQVRNLLLAKVAGSRDSGSLAKSTGMSPYVASKMLVKQRGLTEEAIKTAFIQIVDTEYAIKTGEGKADVLVEQLILRISGGLSRRPESR